MAHRGIWLAATACLVAGVLAAPPGSGLEGTGRSQAAAETSYQPSGPGPVRSSPSAPPAPTAPGPATELPANPPTVPQLVQPAPRPAPSVRPATVAISRPLAPKPKPEQPKPPKPKPPQPPEPPVKPKPTKPKPTIPLPQPPSTSGTTWNGKLIAKTTPDGKTAIPGTKPRSKG